MGLLLFVNFACTNQPPIFIQNYGIINILYFYGGTTLGVKNKQQKSSIEHTTKKNHILILCNILLIIIAVLGALMYSKTIVEQKNRLQRDAFCTTVESIKQVSENYLYTEKGYVDDWAAYISSRHMTAEEALDYINTTNTHADRLAHLIDMDNLSARSSGMTGDDIWVHCYEDMKKLNTKYARTFISKMHQIFKADSNEVLVLGKYRIGEKTQKTVISVGNRVTIREKNGRAKDYLLLRLIPVEYMQNSWAFPTEFPAAEISLIAQDGGYVVQSPSLRSQTFLQFIRAYNFPDDYNRINALEQQLRTNTSGLWEYKNSKGEPCYFYYSTLGKDSNIDILGYIPASEIRIDHIEWSIIHLICGVRLLLGIIDGIYFLSINRRLHKALDLAEEASAAKTQFLSSMSHDIRTPMNAVIGMTDIAKNNLDKPDFARECLDKARISGEHLLTLINDILDISKVESGMMSLSPAPVSIHAIVLEIQEMLWQSASNKHISLEVNIHDIIHDVIVADALRIRQILLNLLNNAIKYTNPDGHVVFEITELSEMASDNKHAVLQFIVQDDGMGMSDEFQKNMYTSFARATDTRINAIQGSGLGLAIVKQIIDLMNGHIQCDSEEGKGTTFTLTLELETSEELPQNIAAENILTDTNQGEFTGMHVLVAEDNDMNWEIIEIMLEEHGILVDRASNGQLCIDKLKDSSSPKYDLVLMDVQMPVLNGREATRRLRASTNTYLHSIPIAAMTADAFAEDIHACMEAGMDAHIPKPVDIKQVLSILHKVKRGTLRRKEEKV